LLSLAPAFLSVAVRPALTDIKFVGKPRVA
jgi:hypothetical protein